MTPEEREALKQELRDEIMAEVHTAIWAAIGVHANGPSPAVAAPIGVPLHGMHPVPGVLIQTLEVTNRQSAAPGCVAGPSSYSWSEIATGGAR